MSTVSQNAFSDIFPKQLGIFSPNFTCLLHVHIYAGLQIFIQLSATLTKLCHIKLDHHNVNVHHRPKRTLVVALNNGLTSSQLEMIEQKFAF